MTSISMIRIIIATICVILSATSVSSFAPLSSLATGSKHATSAISTPNLTFASTTFTSLASTATPIAVPKEKVSKELTPDQTPEKKSAPNKDKGWAIRLYNDPMNKREFVARCLTEVCGLSDGAAYQCMMQAHQLGLSVVGQYHLEMAELYRDQLTEQGLLIDMIPVDDDK